MLKILRITAFMMICSFMCSYIALAAPAESDLIHQQEVLGQQIEQKEQELTQKKAEQSKALTELKTINKTLSSTEKKLRSTESKLNKLLAELDQLETAIKDGEENLAGNVNLLSERLNTIYAQGNVHILEVLLSSTSFTDFLTRWDLVSRLAKMDCTLIDEVKEQISATQEQKTRYWLKRNPARSAGRSKPSKRRIEIGQFQTKRAVSKYFK